MGNIQIFKNESLGEVRVAGTSEEPLFCLADICKVLGLRVDAVQSRLSDAPIRIGVTDSLGREQQMNFVNEKNLYKVIMRSDKPQAEPFQDWVCGEVLPSIRKTGEYSVKPALPKTYFEALKELVVVVEANEMLTLENKTMKPKAEYFDNLVERNMLTNIRDTAKQIGVKEKELFNFSLKVNTCIGIKRSSCVLMPSMCLHYLTLKIMRTTVTPGSKR